MFGVFLLELFAFPKRPSYFDQFGSYGMGFKFMENLAKKDFTMENAIEECLNRFGVDDSDIRSRFMIVLESCLAFDVSSRANSEELYELCQKLACDPINI